MVSLAGDSIGAGVINGQGYIEITFSPTVGNTIDPATITGNEIQISGPGAAPVTLTGTATREGTSNTWRYGFSGQLALGTYTVTFLAGAFADTAGIVNQAFTETFSVSSPTSHAGLAVIRQRPEPGHPQRAHLGRRHLPGDRRPVDRPQLDHRQPVHPHRHRGRQARARRHPGPARAATNPASNVYRYFFSGYTGQRGGFTLTFAAGTWRQLLTGTASATGDIPTSSQYTVTSSGTWVDVTLTPPLGQTVDATTVTAATMTLSGAGLGTIAPVTGASNYPIVQIDANTFRFFYTGAFAAGQVTATFAAGQWADSAGNQGTASAASFTVIAPAQSFYIELSGGIILNAAGFTSSPLMQLSADVKLEIDSRNKIFKLSFNGQLSIYKLGTVGATAGFFELDLSNQLASGPQIWGVATLATNFSALQPYGIFLYGSGTLQINLTQQEHDDTLTLPGSGPQRLQRHADLQPPAAVLPGPGRRRRLDHPARDLDAARLPDGGFLLSLNPGGMTIYVDRLALLRSRLVQAHLWPGHGAAGHPDRPDPGTNPGIAGFLTVGAGADLGIPGVGSLFSISGTVSVMFNTTLQDQVFQIPDAFLPLLQARRSDLDHDLRLRARADRRTQPAGPARRRGLRLGPDQRPDHDRRRNHPQRLRADPGRRGDAPACSCRSPARSAPRSRSSGRWPGSST